VYSEIIKAYALSDDVITTNHYRNKDGYEVDFVLEMPFDKVIGIEVRVSKMTQPNDLRGLKRLKQATRKRFVCGIILHNGDRIQQFAPSLFAMPFDMLWETESRS